MKELRRNLDEYSYEEIHDCVVPLLAYAVFEAFNDQSSRKFITRALKGNTSELGFADNAKSILKVPHTTELTMDSDKCEIGKSIVDYGCEQLKEEYSDDIGKLSVKVYCDDKSEYLLENLIINISKLH